MTGTFLRSGLSTRRSAAWARADLEQLKLSPEVAWYLEDRGYQPPTCVPAMKTPEPSCVRGSHFDPERVDKVIAAFRRLRHVKGRFAGQPFEPACWQVAYYLAPVFGWVAKVKGHRRLCADHHHRLCGSAPQER